MRRNRSAPGDDWSFWWDHEHKPRWHYDLRETRGALRCSTLALSGALVLVISEMTRVQSDEEKITLTPSSETYIASGTWNFVGRGSIGGAGGQNRTGYARLFRAALYQ